MREAFNDTNLFTVEIHARPSVYEQCLIYIWYSICKSDMV